MRRFFGILVSIGLLAGALIASPGAVLPAQAASISKLVAVPADPVKGEQFTVSGKLSTAAVRKVQLQRKSGSKWKAVASAKTDASGQFSFTTSTKAKSVKLRVVAKKAKVAGLTYRKLTSKNLKVETVGQRGTISTTDEARINQSLRVALAFTPVREGRPVQVQWLVADSWETVAESVQDSAGSASIPFTPLMAGTQTYRGIAPAWHGAAAITTGVLNLDVGIALPGDGGRLGFTPLSSGNAYVNQYYALALVGSGGTQPYAWDVKGLPVGLSLSGSGVAVSLSGTPTAAGTYAVTVTLSDKGGEQVSQVVTIKVTA